MIKMENKLNFKENKGEDKIEKYLTQLEDFVEKYHGQPMVSFEGQARGCSWNVELLHYVSRDANIASGIYGLKEDWLNGNWRSYLVNVFSTNKETLAEIIKTIEKPNYNADEILQKIQETRVKMIVHLAESKDPSWEDYPKTRDVTLRINFDSKNKFYKCERPGIRNTNFHRIQTLVTYFRGEE